MVDDGTVDEFMRDTEQGLDLGIAYPLSTYSDQVSWWVWVLFFGLFVFFYTYHK